MNSDESGYGRHFAPVIGMPCCLKTYDQIGFHSCSDKYVRAITAAAGGIPLLVPAMGEPALALLDRVDGLLLTGSPSNIEPHHYDGPSPPPDNDIDPARDATTLPMIRAAIDRGMPVLGICRGMQELNVALGGTLYQELHAVDGRMDHRSDKTVPMPERYRPKHRVTLLAGSLCADLAATQDLVVNSLHGQGIERLAPALSIEALAPDGQVEAVRMTGSNFAMAVQWHPEWTLGADNFSSALFQHFGDACRRYAQRRDGMVRAA